MSDIKTTTIGASTYTLKLFPAMEGWDIQTRVMECWQQERLPTSTLMFDVISKGAALGSVSFDEKKFNTHFRGKLQEMNQLFQEICAYNFGLEEQEGPNGESASTEE